MMLQDLKHFHKEAFDRDGYVSVPGLLGADEVQDLLAWTDEVQAWPETPGRWMKYFEFSQSDPGQRLLCRVEDFVPYHQGFQRLLAGGPLLKMAETLFGEPAVLFKEKINFKLPGGDGFQPHQDVQAGWDVWGTLHITVMVAIDPVNEGNGRLEIVAGHHRRGLLGPMGAPLEEQHLVGCSFVGLDCQPGDALFFDSFAPHRSAPNTSDRARRILYVTYGRLSEGDHRARYFSEKRKSFPPDCEREPGHVYQYKV